MSNKSGKSNSGQSQRSTSSVGNSPGAQDLADEAREAVQHVKQRVKQGASEAAGEVRQQARSAVREQKEYAAERLSSVSEALHDSADRLRQEEATTFASLIEQAADRIDGFSQYLREQDMKDMIDAAQNWARRNPVLFLGGCFVIGLGIARLVKSTSQASAELDEYEGTDYGSPTYASSGSRGVSGSRFGTQQYGGSAFTPQSTSVSETGSPGATGGGWEEP